MGLVGSAIWTISLHNGTMLSVLILVFFVAFILLVKWHNRIKQALALSQAVCEINIEEINRLRFHFDGIADGAAFADDHHPYTSDLDIFGRKSLFQLLNRAGTQAGLQKVKQWISTFANKETIETRQKMAQELMPMVAWRQHLQAHARHTSTQKNKLQAFEGWLHGSDFISGKAIYRSITYLMTIATLAIFAAIFMGYLPGTFFFLPFFISAFFLYKIHDYSRKSYEMTEAGVKLLSAAEQMLLAIEKQEFAHAQLGQLQHRLTSRNLLASQKIGELRKILEWLNLRGNQIYHIFNGLFLLDYLFLYRAERWRTDFGAEVPAWFEVIGEMEALCSVAAFAFAHDEYVFPSISEQPYTYRCIDLGHPLIAPQQRISNSFELKGRGSTAVITGSNMAGKSTFLRTVGINAVLAFAGAPVCATEMTISVFQVFSSMRTKDNLEENISSFYAELLRLKMLLEQINEERTVFYLLDEILKGTNSVDRHIGAQSLLLQLNNMNVFGLVSTHDLELGKLGIENESISNYNFSSEIMGEEIFFDYKLRPGICQSTNASQLMAKIGINIKP